MTYMNNELLDVVFAIEKQINKIRPDEDKLEWMDSGMFLGEGNAEPSVLWRDYAYQYKDEHGGKEYAFSFSSDGDYQGDIDPAIRDGVLEVLAAYQGMGK